MAVAVRVSIKLYNCTVCIQANKTMPKKNFCYFPKNGTEPCNYVWVGKNISFTIYAIKRGKKFIKPSWV